MLKLRLAGEKNSLEQQMTAYMLNLMISEEIPLALSLSLVGAVLSPTSRVLYVEHLMYDFMNDF